jgi:predicted secreted protein
MKFSSYQETYGQNPLVLLNSIPKFFFYEYLTCHSSAIQTEKQHMKQRGTLQREYPNQFGSL